MSLWDGETGSVSAAMQMITIMNRTQFLLILTATYGKLVMIECDFALNFDNFRVRAWEKSSY
jgi:hypothetical protein